jgi:hypothetical protein
MVKVLDVSSTSLRTIVENDLNPKPYKKQKVHSLTETKQAAKVQKCRQLLAWHAVDDIFSDEKLFLLQETHN